MCGPQPGTLWKLCFGAVFNTVCGLDGELGWAAGAGEVCVLGRGAGFPQSLLGSSGHKQF